MKTPAPVEVAAASRKGYGIQSTQLGLPPAVGQYTLGVGLGVGCKSPHLDTRACPAAEKALSHHMAA